MGRAKRDDVFDSSMVGVYHCVHRAVRRAWLCGRDKLTGKSFEHRRQWIEDQMAKLSAIFAFDMLAYAIMDNHFHLVTRNRPDILGIWSDREVALRWWRLCPKRKEADGTAAIPTPEELAPLMVPFQNEKLRARLGSVSWLMRYLAEPIARRANREDECTGHFWEGRFKCQRLLDEASLLACCAYVELNPIRAGVADLPENSKYTSIYKRIAAKIEEAELLASAQERSLQPQVAAAQTQSECSENLANGNLANKNIIAVAQSSAGESTLTLATATTSSVATELSNVPMELNSVATDAAAHVPLAVTAIEYTINRSMVPLDAWLAPVAIDSRASAYAGAMPAKSQNRASDKGFLQMSSEMYIQLIDWIGRQLRGDRGVIPEAAEPILKRIGLEPDGFCELVHRFGKIFKQAAGTPASLAKEAARRNQRWIQCHNSPLKDIAAATG